MPLTPTSATRASVRTTKFHYADDGTRVGGARRGNFGQSPCALGSDRSVRVGEARAKPLGSPRSDEAPLQTGVKHLWLSLCHKRTLRETLLLGDVRSWATGCPHRFAIHGQYARCGWVQHAHQSQPLIQAAIAFLWTSPHLSAHNLPLIMGCIAIGPSGLRILRFELSGSCNNERRARRS